MDIIEANARCEHDFSRHPWELARWDLVSKIIEPHMRWGHDEPRIVLDIGCGDGFVARAIAKRYPAFKVIGIDPHLDLGKRENGPGTNIAFYRSLDAAEQVLDSVHLILLLDVLEHIEEDSQFLQSIIGLRGVHSQTKICITVPAYPALFSRHDRRLRHFRRYRRRTLLRLVEMAGIRPLRSGYFFFSLLVVRALQRFLEPIVDSADTEKNIGVSAWRGTRAVTNVIRKMLFLEASLAYRLTHINFFLPGLSCFVICQQQPS